MFASPADSLQYDLKDETATRELAARLAGFANPGDVIALEGDLGSGKTVFARAFVGAYCGHDEEVPSPTFTLVQVYDSPAGPVYHFDLYRVKSETELLELGVEDAFAEGVTLVEWPDRLGAWLPADRLTVSLRQGPRADARIARLTGHGYWQARLMDGFGDGAIHGG